MKSMLKGFLIVSTIACVNFTVRAADVISQEKAETLPDPTVTSTKEKNIVASEDLQQRGRDLHTEIENTYTNLKKTHSLRQAMYGGNDVTEIVSKYIPVGISFENAEKILIAAGCEIAKWNVERHDGELTYKDNVSGTLKLSSDFPSVVKFAVILTPIVPGDYSIVSKVFAGIGIAFI